METKDFQKGMEVYVNPSFFEMLVEETKTREVMDFITSAAALIDLFEFLGQNAQKPFIAFECDEENIWVLEPTFKDDSEYKSLLSAAFSSSESCPFFIDGSHISLTPNNPNIALDDLFKVK